MTQNIDVFTEKLHMKWRKLEALDNSYFQKHMSLPAPKHFRDYSVFVKKKLSTMSAFYSKNHILTSQNIFLVC